MIRRTRPSLTAICMLLIPIVVAVFNKILPIPSDLAVQPSAGSVAVAAAAGVDSESPDVGAIPSWSPVLVKVSDPPEIVTVGCRFPENTWSADRQGRQGMTNFSWYAKDLFGVSLEQTWAWQARAWPAR